MRDMLRRIGLPLACAGALALDASHALDFTKGDKPPADAQAYSLHLGGITGVPNGNQKKGRDGNQIYVLTYTDGLYSRNVLQVGDVILGVNGKPFAGDVIETWRAAVADAPQRRADGNLRIIRWRNGAQETLDFLTVLPPPDLTKGETNGVNRTLTYNLGPTGMRGWIHTKASSNLDALQGRTTTASRQILVTHIGANSPAAGIMETNDVILGVDGKLFSDDARKSFGRAITEAEKAGNKGVLRLIRFRNGKTSAVQLKLKVMGSYSATAPYDCPKSKQILADACKALEREELHDSLWGAVNGLALLATGNPAYLPKVQEFARRIAPDNLDLKGCDTWNWGYKNLFLCEYYLATGDKQVLPGLKAYTVALARGQGLYGTFGHGGSVLTADGKLHGSIPPYGPVNQAGLVANLAIVMGRKCGVVDPEIDPAIWRATRFFSYYVDKGAVPYGEHMPCPMHENNGKDSLAALLFSIEGHQPKQAQYFARMATAAYANRECGHTGQGFSYLWSALGANAGGPDAVAAFMKEARWHLDLVRRCDGSFTYDGGEQYGPGRTDDDTYYGNSSYCGLSPNATYVLTYSIPLNKLCITGKDADMANWLSRKDVSAAIASGRFDLDCRKMTPAQIVATGFADWSPVVRGWAAIELARRPEAASMVPALIAMAEGPQPHMRQGACEALGYIGDTNALPALIRLLKHDDRWLRVKAANALKNMGEKARPVLTDMLQALVDTAEPIQPIVWADPIQLTHEELAAALFDGLLRSSVDGVDRKLLYPAIEAVAGNASGMARSYLADTFTSNLTLADVQQLAPYIFAAIKEKAPADTMFGNDLRMAGSKLLAKYHFREGIRAIVDYVKIIDGHGSQERVPVLMKQLKSYGAAARDVVPELKEIIEIFNTQCRNRQFPEDCNRIRVASVEDAIQSIEAATDQPELRSIRQGGSRKGPVKVFILAGQSNMEGQAVADLDGDSYNGGRGTLAALMRDPLKGGMVKHLKNADGSWVVRDDVWVRYKREGGPLLAGQLSLGFSVYGDRHHFGPELQFGHIVGDALTNQVLIIKTAWGGKSLDVDFRPPSSGGQTGPYYTKMLEDIREALANLKKDFPAYDGGGYELAGFAWWHGWNDFCDSRTAVPAYEANLVNLIHDLRKDLNAPGLPVVIGEFTGVWGADCKEAAAVGVRRAQKAAAERPEFKGSALFVETHDFVRKPEDSPNPSHGHHEYGNAETYFLVGDALGKGTVKLLNQ